MGCCPGSADRIEIEPVMAARFPAGENSVSGSRESRGKTVVGRKNTIGGIERADHAVPGSAGGGRDAVNSRDGSQLAEHEATLDKESLGVSSLIPTRAFQLSWIYRPVRAPK
jgi:hypothetical protein